MTKSENDSDTGQGIGHGKGAGHGKNNGGAMGNGGFCICAKCGTKLLHQQGIKCTTVTCPDCGHKMIREELLEAKHTNN